MQGASRILVIVAVASALGPLATEAAPAGKKHKKSLQDLQTERLCDGNQLRASVTNPVCQGWIINNFVNSGSPEATYYHSSYPDACTQASDGAVYCAFPGSDTTCTSQDTVVSCQAKQAANQMKGKAACVAYVDAISTLSPVRANLKPYCPTGMPGNPGSFRCAWCLKGEQGCAPGSNGKGKYIAGQVCNGGESVFPFDTVPAAGQTPYCSTVVSGPYRNHADSYTACGSTQTQGYPGMIYVYDQTKQVRKINKDANNQVLKSDLRGFCYPRTGTAPCAKPKLGNPDICIEPDDLNEHPGTQTSAQVHHIVPKNDRRSCPCGANTMKNAAVISQRLNAYFTNKNRNQFTSLCPPMKTEVQWVNDLPPWP